MTVDQALQLAASLIDASIKALTAGDSIVDLTSGLQAADDAAREELATAISEAEKRLAKLEG